MQIGTSTSSAILYNPYSSHNPFGQSRQDSAHHEQLHGHTSESTAATTAARKTATNRQIPENSTTSNLGKQEKQPYPDNPLRATDDKTNRTADKTKQDSQTEKNTENDYKTKAEINKLKQRQNEVIAHESAHKAVGGQYTGAVSYTYTTGPDGKKYINGGEVSISTPSTSDPEEALRIAEKVKAAALAPANPSSQDIAVASGAAQTIASARAEIAALKRAELAEKQHDNTTNKKEKTDSASPLMAEPSKAEETSSTYGKQFTINGGHLENRATDNNNTPKMPIKPNAYGVYGIDTTHNKMAIDSYNTLSVVGLQNTEKTGQLHAVG